MRNILLICAVLFLTFSAAKAELQTEAGDDKIFYFWEVESSIKPIITVEPAAWDKLPATPSEVKVYLNTKDGKKWEAIWVEVDRDTP